MDLNFIRLVVILAIQICWTSGACINNKYSVVAGHTGCITKSPSARHFRDMTGSIKESIVNIHNTLRAQMNATNMQKMVWDEELATLAQMWADNCEFKHDSGKRAIPGRFSVGQNLGLGHQSWSAVLNSWWDEISEFSYNRRTDMVFSRVGHYTQMAWAESAKVGCGWAQCTNPEMMQFFGGRYYVCNYGAAGNRQWWTPYNITNAQGNTRKCSSCPNSCDRDGLCDCGGKVCENGGKLDLNTCQCRCVKSFHTRDTCGLDCDRAVDSRHCGTFWQLNDCQRFTNVPFECPNMCGLCPLADFRLQNTNVTSPVATTPSTTVTTAAPLPTVRPATRQTTTRPAPTPSATVTTAKPPVTNVIPPAVVDTVPSIIVNITDGVSGNITGASTNTTNENTQKAIDIKIEQKNGKTLISIPNKKVLSNNSTKPGSNGGVRVVGPPTSSSGLYSTLVLILNLV